MEDYYLDTEKEFAVVVPVHNSEELLEELFQRIEKTLNRFSQKWQVIFVDDFSKDYSWQVIKKLKESYPQVVKGVRLSRNYGQHNATLCGIKHSKAAVVITIDDDLEFSPEDIERLVEVYQKGDSDLVYGVDVTKRTNKNRDFLTALFRKMQTFFHKEPIIGSSFRLIKNEIAQAIISNARDFSYIDEFLPWYTSRITVVKIKTVKTSLKSRYKILDLIGMTKSVIFLSSNAPIKMVTIFGFLMMSINFLLGVILIITKLFFIIEVKGFTSIVVAILFSSGAIIFCIGIVAEYIGKILKMIYSKPSYFESEIL